MPENPPTKQAQRDASTPGPDAPVMDPGEVDAILERAWKRYLQVVRDQGLEDRKRQPTPEDMLRRCDV